jgi:hypothetical protein
MNHEETHNPQEPIPEYIEPEWVDTPTSTKIWNALQYAQTMPTIALIHGPGGLGKTHTSRRYLAERARKFDGYQPYGKGGRPTVYMVTAHPGMSTVASVLSAISEEIGRLGDAYRNDVMARQILAALTPGDLLIMDEAQHLDIKALDQIRHFHDVGQIGIAYLGNDDIYTRINGRGRQAAFLGPLKSRVGKRLAIPHPSEDDISSILSAWNVKGKKEVDYANQIGLSSIGLRGLTQVLRQAAFVAKSMNHVLDTRVMRVAVTNLGFAN